MKVKKSSGKDISQSSISLPRMSLNTSITNHYPSKKVTFDKNQPRRSSIDAGRLKTEPTPTTSLSLTQFWKLQSTPSQNNLTFTKIGGDEEITKHYLSRVLINYQTNILQSFKKLRDPSKIQFKIKDVNKSNKWYKRASNAFALNSRINEQKSFWRLLGIKQVVEKTSYSKYIDMVIYPQQYVNCEPHYKALIEMESMIRSHNLRKVIYLFRIKERQKTIKKRYINRVNRNHQSMIKQGLENIRSLPNKGKLQRFYKIRDKLWRFLSNFTNKNIIRTFDIIKQNRNYSKLKKCAAIHEIVKNTYRNVDKLFMKWVMFTKQKRQFLKRQKVIQFFQMIQSRQQKNFSYILEGCDVNLSSKIQVALKKLLEVQQLFRKQHLSRTFKKWKGKDNAWFERAAFILSLNTILNNQTSLWRLRSSFKRISV